MWCQVIRSAAPVTQNHLSKPEDLMLQSATPLRKSAPWPPNSCDEHVSCTAPAMDDASLQILFKCPTPAIVFGMPHTPDVFAHFLTRCKIPVACHAKRHLNVQKWSEPLVCFHILTSKCASRHNGVHFHLQMGFAPQGRALFRHLNFKKCSHSEVFLAFSLANVLRATTACNSSSLIWPAGSAPAALASLLFDPPERQISGKTQCFATFHTFLPFRTPGSSSFWDFLFCDLLSSSLLFASLLWLFPSLLFICPYCRKFDF